MWPGGEDAQDGVQGSSEEGIPLHYKGTKFHRIISGFMAQVRCQAAC